jgi:hypothetical protein
MGLLLLAVFRKFEQIELRNVSISECEAEYEECSFRSEGYFLMVEGPRCREVKKNIYIRVSVILSVTKN